MKIAILRGSPCKSGSSNLLADHFIRGAEESGHVIIDIDVAHADIHPCTGCKACGFHRKPCVLNDAMAEIRSFNFYNPANLLFGRGKLNELGRQPLPSSLSESTLVMSNLLK